MPTLLPMQLMHHAIRLSIFTQFYPPDYAATGQLIEELSTRLADYGIHVQVFTGQPSYAFSQNEAPVCEGTDSLKIRRSRTSRLWPYRVRGRVVNGLLFCIRAGLRLLNPFQRTDLLLLTTEPPYLNFVGLMARSVLGIPYICLVYDLYPDVAIALGVVSKRHWVARLWDHFNCMVWRKSEALIVLSSSMKARIIAKCPGIEHKIKVIHSWSNPDHIVPIPKAQNWFAQKHHLDRKFTVLYSGNMGRCHDMATIMEAARLLKDEPVQFVFIGHGAKQGFCINFANQWQLTNCLFLPFQDKKNLPYSLTACDVSLISIAEGMEGLVAPSKLYGSLAAGKPIAAICEPHSYLRHIVADAGCGAAIDNKDAQGLAQFILHLLSDPTLTQKMGHGGRQYLEKHFTPVRIAQHYFEVILNCVQTNPRSLEEWTLKDIAQQQAVVQSSSVEE